MRVRWTRPQTVRGVASSTHQIAAKVHVLGVALAPPAEEVRRAGADAAHVGPVARALHRVLDVALEKERFRLSRNLRHIYLFMQRNECILRPLTGFPGFSQSHWHIISRLTMTASSMPTGLIWKVCFHSRGSLGNKGFNQFVFAWNMSDHYSLPWGT